MHIADGFINQPASLLTIGIAAAGIGWAANRVRTNTTTEQLKLAPAVGMAVFAGQMVNFAVGSEMSGHLVGSALAAILLGPALAMIAMAVVLILQCVFFADGGVTALGANFLSMGFVGVLVAHYLWNRLRETSPKWVAGGIAAWASVVASSIVCSATLATSGITPEMLANHSVIGLAEAGVTIMALLAIGALGSTRAKITGVLATAATAAALSPLASTLPDGMEAALSGTGYVFFGALVAAPTLFFTLRALNQANARNTVPVRNRK